MRLFNTELHRKNDGPRTTQLGADDPHKIKNSFEVTADRDYDVDDITAVYCARLHQDNPWMIDRLHLVASHYAPRPRVLVCDFGSHPEFAQTIERACKQHSFTYLHVPDGGVYSAAIAHNRAFEEVATDLIFFSDIDTIGHSTMFEDLARLASDIGMKQYFDIPLILPVVHLSRTDTQDCLDVQSRGERSSKLSRLALSYIYRERSQPDDVFVVPYSNIYLMRRDLFDLVGGYDERFRGHGSEDFEFLTRLGLYGKHLPLPRDWRTDRYSVLRIEFYEPKEYAGFRRLIEAMAYPAEMLGQRVYHLWHPRRDDDWRSENDWKRERLNQAFDAYADDHSKLLSVDFLSRHRRALCVCKHRDHWGYFLPLRLAGYHVAPLFNEDNETLASAAEMIKAGAIDAFCIFNPYMQSHAAFLALFQLAKDYGVKTIVVERGALPKTVYYDEDVAYNSLGFSQEAFDRAAFSETEISLSSAYVTRLRSGADTLEEQDTYEATALRHPNLPDTTRTVCFIPTQIDDDMAVTHFVKGEHYASFVESLPQVVEANPNILFVVKPHPLSKLADMAGKPNLIVADRRDNVHFFIDVANVVICYNSGVGLLALLHGKPTITIGNAFYNYEGAGHRAASLAHAVEMIQKEISAPSAEMVARLAAWFHLRKYSTFVAMDEIREFERRRSHAYKDVLVTCFRWANFDIWLGRQRAAMPVSKRSYLWARIGMTPAHSGASPPWGIKQKVAHKVALLVLYFGLSAHDRKRLKSNPIDFFKRAKWPPNRFFGRLLLDKSQRPY